MEQNTNNLKRGLTLVTLFTLLTGAMVGMAWAVLANSFMDRSGPAGMIGLALAAVFTLFVGLCFAELCSMMPVAGGAYIYVRRSMNKFAGFITGWLLVLAYAAMMPGECIIIGKLVSGIFPGVPVAWIGVGAAVIFTSINLIGITFSAILQLVLTLILFGGIFAYALPGIASLQIENFAPFFGRGAAGVFLMVPIYFLGFMGYDILPQAAQEVNAPIRKMVFVIPMSIFFVFIAYLVVGIANAGVVPWEQLAKNTDPVPINFIATKLLGPSGATIVILAGLAGLVTTLNGFVVGASRLMMAMARDHELPSVFANVNKRFGVPHWAIIFVGILGIIGSFVPKLIVLFDTAASAVLITYMMTAVAVMMLRRREPDAERPYRMPGGAIIPILALIGTVPTFLLSLAILTMEARIVFVAWIIIGVLYYWIFRRRKT
ncbi:MAG: amino acid permease [Deltaproteobacteria bacterium]|nr:amino acid permease [Deltaproteobacteria bacterium]